MFKVGGKNGASIFALVAAAGLAFGAGSASAADLGGNCCADLEERVAELEATAARKGNRKVSLQIYGQVSEALIWWNDGAESNAYVLENYLLKNRLGFSGNAKISSDWSAGYQLEIGIRAYRSSNATQLSLGASNNVTIATYNTQSVALRQANWWIKSNTYGQITVGRTQDAVNGTSGVNLANPDGFSGITGPGYINNGYFLRRSGRTGNAGLSDLSWGDTGNFRNGDGPASMGYSETGSQIKYTSPFFLGQSKSTGFRFDASYGMDDFWSVALRYAETWGQFRFAAAVGYAQWMGPDRGMCSTGSNTFGTLTSTTPATNRGSTIDCNSLQASASLMHTPTGLYITAQGGRIQDKLSMGAYVANSTNLAPGTTTRAGNDGEHSIWGLQLGWQAKLNTLGNTTFWGQYVQYNTGLGVRNSNVQTVGAGDILNSIGGTALIAGSATEYWGGGVSQEITAASMVLYAGFYTGSQELTLQAQSATAIVQRARSHPIDDFKTVFTGATIRF